MKIPEWNNYFPDIKIESKETKDAYSYLSKKWNKKEKFEFEDIEKYSSYIFYYLYKANDHFFRKRDDRALKLVEQKYEIILKFYRKDYPKLFSYTMDWIIQMARSLNNFNLINKWVETYLDHPEWWLPNYRTIDFLGNALYQNKDTYIPSKYFPDMFNIQTHLSSFGKQLSDDIGDYMCAKLDEEYKKNGENFIFKFSKIKHWDVQVPTTIDISKKGGNLDAGLLVKLNNDKLKKFVRDSENEWRLNHNLPKIGEGWIGETYLFEQLKNTFTNQLVLMHAKTKFLGKQHYDVYFPEYKIACEYQGEQHFKPVEYFGGQQAFDNGQIRDRRKKAISTRNNVKLIYVMPNYNIIELVTQIAKYMQIPVPSIITIDKTSLTSNKKLKRYIKTTKK